MKRPFKWTVFIGLMIAVLCFCGTVAAEDAVGLPELLATWTASDGGDQDAVLKRTAGEDGPVYRLEIPERDLPQLSFFRISVGPEDSVQTSPLFAEYAGEAADGSHAFILRPQEDSGDEIWVYIILNPAEPSADPEASAIQATPVPGKPVTVIASYQTPEGTEIAEDDVYQAPRGAAFPVYAKTIEGGWIRMNDPLQYVDVTADAPDTLHVVFLYTQPTPTPAPPNVKITVHYRDVGGVPVASDTEVTGPGGTAMQITAEPADLKENYFPTGESVQTVTIGTDGKPMEIIFFYTYKAPATPAPAFALVRYVDENGEPVAQDGRVSGAPGQEMIIYAAPEQLMDFYELDDENTQKIILPESGETVTVTFRYRLELPQTPVPTNTPEPPVTPTPQPAPAVGFVQVSYIYQGNDSLNYSEPVTVYEGETVLSGADGERTGYVLVSAGEARVTVNDAGQVEPNSVTFVYAPESGGAPMPELIVHYRAEDGTPIATSTLTTLHLGENTVYAAPVDLQAGYEQVTPSYTVTVDEQGKADQDTVIFYYHAIKENNTSSEGFQVQPASGYARAVNDSVNLRSYPSTASSDNIIGKIQKADIIQILGTASNSGKWYYVSVNERQGYVSASVVTELSDEDVQVLKGLRYGDTNGDDQLMDPDTGLIERWAQVSKKVWFRAAVKGKKLKELKKGTKVFVDEAQDDEGTLWYKVRYNSKEGYIMAEFLTLYSAAESQNLQFSLPTAVPTHTVPATRVPTSTPTAYIPTPSPTPVPATPAPVMTVTPLPYSGYAVTNTRAAVRGGLSADNAALVTLNGETLVMVQGQTYVGGICWDSIRVISSGVTGFIEDDRLFHVTNEVAQEYLEIQATPTPAPTPDNTPIPFTGYALVLTEGVPLRQQMNSNAQYISILNYDAVVSVLRQSTADDGTSWCLVQSGMYLGYVRRELLRQMTDEEIFTYLESIRSRPTPTPQVTPTPRAQSAMASCWGIIKRDRVHLRSHPSMSEGTALRLMSRNEFIQIQGSFLGDDNQVWQQVMTNGQTGYIRADYVQILTQGELTSVVTSEDFKSANTTETTVTGVDSIQSYETYLANQLAHPSLSASYEPFDPYTTPAAVIAAQTPEPQRTPSVTMPPTPAATIIMDPDRTAQPNTGGGISFGAVLAGAGILAIGGGVAFAWMAFRGRKRRQALQRAQAIRRRQANVQEQAEEPQTHAYRRDAQSDYAGRTSARPVPRTTRENEPLRAGTRRMSAAMRPAEEDRTQAFRRPETEEFVRDPEPAAIPQIAFDTIHSSEPDISDEGAAERPVRRRRTERNHYDEDGN